MLKRLTVLLIAGLVIAGVVAVYYMPQWQQTQAASKSGGRRGGPPSTDPVPVLATAARSADVPVYLDGVGTAKALNTVTVRSQVDGKIINISFTEGQDVPKGFVLAKIDPTTYQAQYDQAQSRKKRRTRRSSPTPGSISIATRGWRRPTPSTSSSSTPSGRRSASSRRRSSSTRRRSTTRAPSWATPTSSRRSPAAPASVWWMKAISCAARIPPAS